MSLWPHDDTASLTAFYGPPGLSSNMVLVTAPWQMTYAGRPVRGVQIHRKLAASLRAVFADIALAVGNDWSKLPKGAVAFSGSFNDRPVRGSSRKSCHSFGAAIDMDSVANPMNTRGNRGTMSPIVINAFKRQGWFWGGDFQHRQDPMHFQAANEGNYTPTGEDFDSPEGFSELKMPLEAEDVTQGSPYSGSEDPPAIGVAPPPVETLSENPEVIQAVPSMIKSKTGLIAVGLGAGGAGETLQQVNQVASEVSMLKYNADSLGAWKGLAILLNHPLLLVGLVVLAAAVFVWFDHRKYKRLLSAAQKGA
jgi:hypothetical protein